MFLLNLMKYKFTYWKQKAFVEISWERSKLNSVYHAVDWIEDAEE